jgi:hypothetical protein
VMDNQFANNNAWGVILVTYLDSGPPCSGGTVNGLGPGTCVFDDWGNALISNVFSHNGSYGHPTNGAFDQLNFENGHPTDCYSGNTEAGGGSLSPDAASLQQSHPSCTGQAVPANPNPPFLNEVLCDSRVEVTPGVPPACPTGPYPRRQNVKMHPLPPARELTTMPNPCAGVPANPWCPVTKRRTRA